MLLIQKKEAAIIAASAVDLTLINLKTKEELPMGTGFDNFSDTAHQTFIALPEQILHNRNLLKNLMEKNGFKPLETEWWHYFLPNANEYEILDVSFKAAKLNTIKLFKRRNFFICRNISVAS